MTYEEFKKTKDDLTSFGIEIGPNRSDYFCTPIGMKVFGWAGVDGVHYGFIRGFGEMVFEVEPMGIPGQYVHPVAESFEDFLRLLLACGGEAAVAQMHCWNRGEYESYCAEYPHEPQEGFGLTPMEDPFAYIKEVQASFDYAALRFKRGYADYLPAEPEEPVAPEWKVYFHGGFFDHQGREHPGKEVPTDVVFDWAGLTWHVPAVYPCTSGLVVDICACVEPDYLLECEQRYIESRKDPDCVHWNNPLDRDTRVDACCNGTILRRRGSTGIIWRPKSQDDWDSRWVLEHYGLDLGNAWFIHRFKFEWEKRMPLKTLTLTLQQEPVAIPAGRFSVKKAGDKVALRHPLTGAEHTLTVVELEQGKLDAAHFRDDDMEYPACYTAMTYRMIPNLPDRAFRIQDCAQGDHARPKAGQNYGPLAGVSAGFVIMGRGGEDDLRVACSSLHFEPVEQVEWRVSFLEKPVDDITIEIVKE